MNRLIGQINRPVIVFIQRVHVPKIDLYKTRYGMCVSGGGVKNLRFWRYVICGRSLYTNIGKKGGKNTAQDGHVISPVIASMRAAGPS